MLWRLFFLVLLSPFIAVSQVNATTENCVEKIKLYTTYQDFRSSTTTDSVCLSVKNNKFSVFYNKLTLKDGGKKRKYAHGSLWAYQRGDDVYRYFDEATTFGTYGYHKILDQSGLIIYSKKESCGYRMSSTCTYYFYSKDLQSPLKKLNLKNLKKDFPNASFIAEAEKLEELTERDEKSGNFKINNVYLLTFKNQEK